MLFSDESIVKTDLEREKFYLVFFWLRRREAKTDWSIWKKII
jgi:hypothetical protein